MVHKYPHGKYFGLDNSAHQSWLELVRSYAKNKKSRLLMIFCKLYPKNSIIFLQIREKHLLDKAYVEYPDFPLVVTGHSLGAGTAVILSFILRLKYNSVKCYAFGPPGGLLNLEAYALSTTFVTSVVAGDDIISRYVLKTHL